MGSATLKDRPTSGTPPRAGTAKWLWSGSSWDIASMPTSLTPVTCRILRGLRLSSVTRVTRKSTFNPWDPPSQCGMVVIATNVEDMFLVPILGTDDQGNIHLYNRDQVFTREIHPNKVDLGKYITNRDEYLYYDITSQAESEFDTSGLPPPTR